MTRGIEMVSIRNYLSICIMMVVFLFMLQFSQVIKMNGNRYNINEYMDTEVLSGAERWQAKGPDAGEFPEPAEPGYVVFVGDWEDSVGRVVSQWCDYTKRAHLAVTGVDEFELRKEQLPELVLIDSRVIDFERETADLVRLAREGVSLVFCNLPDSRVIAGNADLQKLLGISMVMDDAVTVQGIHLFSGLLLGGEAIYQVQDQDDEKFQDLQLVVPWYRVDSGTKTYMVGMMEISSDEDEEDGIKREDLPALIWRNSYENAMVFAVNGDYLSDWTGLGFLDAFVYEMEPYQLYPVINARNTVVANYPNFTADNSEQLYEIYSRTPQGLYRDVMWPGISAVSERFGLRLTCFLMPQYFYADELEPDDDDLVFYLQQFKEIRAEAGRTLEYAGDVTLMEKLDFDESFFQTLEGSYRFGAYYLGAEIPRELNNLLQAERLDDIRTLVCSDKEGHPLVSYYTDEVTLQCTTVNAQDYTYSKDLQMRSIATALGYTNVLIDMVNVTWPQSQEDQWERYFEAVSSNIGTYWSRYRKFAATSLSESDAHVRSFLNLGYQESREGNEIILQVENAGEESWFILRTHKERIVGIQGGTYEEIEEGFYLIHVLDEQVKIELQNGGYRLDVDGIL